MKKCEHCQVYPGQVHGPDCPERKLTVDDFLRNEQEQPRIIRPMAGVDDDGDDQETELEH